MSAGIDELQALLKRCNALAISISSLATYQTQQRPTNDDAPTLDLRNFQRLVISERKSLERAIQKREEHHQAPHSGEDEDEDSGSLPRDKDSNNDSEDEDPSRQAASLDQAASHAARSSNVPYLEKVWRAALREQGVMAIQRKVFLDRPPEKSAPVGIKAGGVSARSPKSAADELKSNNKRNGQSDRKRAPRVTNVDIVAQDGRLWVKLSTVTERRLLFERAREGFESDSSDSDRPAYSDDGEAYIKDGTKIPGLVDDKASRGTETTKEAAQSTGNASSNSSDYERDGISLIHTAQQLQSAAQHVWVDYKHPQVRFLLTSLPSESQATAATKAVLHSLRQLGVEVVIGSQSATSLAAGSSGQADAVLFDRVLPSIHPELTADINLDCTVLLALISDVSHSTLTPGGDWHPSISRQIAREVTRPLLPWVLYPALAGKRLHAARAAVTRMQEIVGTIGTPMERQRAALLLGDEVALKQQQQHQTSGQDRLHEAPSGKEANADASRKAAFSQAWRHLSVHDVPCELQLPVRIVEEHDEPRGITGALASYAESVVTEGALTPLNRAVWLLGWRRGWTTITSNRVVARQLEEGIEARLAAGAGRRGADGDSQAPASARAGPRAWVVNTARSLVKKEHGLRG